MVKKNGSEYVCQNCGAVYPKWQGKCDACGEWNTIVIKVKDGKVTASIVWSSPNYDYMIVDGKKLFPVNTEGNSVFEITVASFDTELDVIADTVAMSKPHEIEYTLAFDSSTIKTAE